MQTDLNFLLGKVIEHVEITPNYLQLFFNDSSVLNVFNIYQLNDNWSNIQNNQLIKLERYNNILYIKFTSEIIISIDMSDNGYNSPEAIVYYYQDQIIIID